MSQTLGEILGRKLPSIYTHKKTFEPEVQPKVPYHLIGIEVEVERVSDKICGEDCPAGWTITEDGSLRNYGLEFVSRPFMSKYVHSMVQRLEEYLPDGHEFSSRTSVHVHFNVLDMTVEELKTAMALYVVFERCIFEFVGKDRDQNIYCQPVYNLFNAHNAFRVPIPKWGKYSAMNLSSIQEKGTVEFRHMWGTCNPLLLTTWVDIITRLFDYARGKNFEQVLSSLQGLSTSSAWHSFSKEVLGELSSTFESQRSFKDNMQKGVRFLRSVTFKAPENLFMEFLKSEYLKFRVPQRYLVPNSTYSKYEKKPMDKEAYMKAMQDVLAAFAVPQEPVVASAPPNPTQWLWTTSIDETPLNTPQGSF